MKYLGIDYGAKRVGIAISDEGGTIAFPRETIANMRGVIGVIKDLIEKEEVGFVVVGDTRSYGSIANPVTSRAERFVDELKKGLNVPVAYGWEAGSSIEANRFDPDHAHSDSAAAAVILQRFLDMKPKQ